VKEVKQLEEDGIVKNIIIKKMKHGNRNKSPFKLKDACYRKAKAKYDVFPSAYASGYIAKCRKRKGNIK